MVTLNEARELALASFQTFAPSLAEGDEFIITDECVTERPTGWVIYPSSRMYSLTRSDDYCILGICPLFIDSATGSVRELLPGSIDQQLDADG